jgi:hypothetical protein
MDECHDRLLELLNVGPSMWCGLSTSAAATTVVPAEFTSYLDDVNS